MKTEAASAGIYESQAYQMKCPKIQILTIEELLEGKGIIAPPRMASVKKAAFKEKTKFKEGKLF